MTNKKEKQSYHEWAKEHVTNKAARDDDDKGPVLNLHPIGSFHLAKEGTGTAICIGSEGTSQKPIKSYDLIMTNTPYGNG